MSLDNRLNSEMLAVIAIALAITLSAGFIATGTIPEHHLALATKKGSAAITSGGGSGNHANQGVSQNQAISQHNYNGQSSN
jgi:hypothetical protein